MRNAVYVVVLLGLAWSSVLAKTPDEYAPTPEQLEFFEKEIRPLLIRHCYDCHGPDADPLKTDLRLDDIGALTARREAGHVVVPGVPDRSLLIEAVRYKNVQLQMPPGGRLSDDQIEALTRWVAMGAPAPDQEPVARIDKEKFDLAARKAGHWCWQPIRRPTLPTIDDEWSSHPIDALIAARLAEQGLRPSESADRHTLIRRLCFDLLGLPPRAEDVRAFANDPSPDAYKQLVDRLLESPQFGPRWGRHWLDLVRYGETYGHERDFPIPHAHQYRDYVIRAFNADVPYDQFIKEQIAGDLLSPPRRHETLGYNESIIGTGFWLLGQANHAPVDVREDEADRFENQLDVFCKSILGLTVACARCHDHKFDAISTRDYYALAGFLKSSRRSVAYLDPEKKITNIDQQLGAVRINIASQWKAAVAEIDNAQLRIAPFLLASGQLLRDGIPDDEGQLETKLTALASQHAIGLELLRRWVEALRQVNPDDRSHPLHAWRALTRADATRGADVDFIQDRDRLRDALADVAGQEADRDVVFASFNDGTLEGWRVRGPAFGKVPTSPGEWYRDVDGTRVTSADAVHSCTKARQLRGTIRSPTFTLDKDFIHYRLAGRNTEVRLVIDGYFMNVYHALLFEGMRFKVNTQGNYVWQSQGKSVARYRGQRAYIEIVDHGDGWVAVDEIRFSNSNQPLADPSEVARAALDDESVTSIERLAERYDRIWKETIARWQSDKLLADDTALIDWMLHHQLFQFTNDQLAALLGAVDTLGASLPDPMQVLCLEDGTEVDEYVFVRGSHRNQGEDVPRRFLESVSGPEQPIIEQGSGRLELARRMLEPGSPLPARVMANRVWHHLLGRGIVPSTDDFGVMGDLPTHPELLDYLADWYRNDAGWSTKRLIRHIVTSRTYQMTSRPSDALAETQDPTNIRLHRAQVRRLQGEALRDAILAVSGRLDDTLYGEPVPAHLSPFNTARGRPTEDGPLDGDGRRTIFVEVRRNYLSPFQTTFDMPFPRTTMGRRSVSNVPAQSLILMNDPFVVEQAQRWAARLLEVEDHSSSERIEEMYLAAFARPPNEQELADAVAFMDEQAETYGDESVSSGYNQEVWSDLCHALFNVKEFLFVR